MFLFVIHKILRVSRHPLPWRRLHFQPIWTLSTPSLNCRELRQDRALSTLYLSRMILRRLSSLSAEERKVKMSTSSSDPPRYRDNDRSQGQSLSPWSEEMVPFLHLIPCAISQT